MTEFLSIRGSLKDCAYKGESGGEGSGGEGENRSGYVPQSGGVSLHDVPRLPVRLLEHLPHLGVLSGLGGHSQDAA